MRTKVLKYILDSYRDRLCTDFCCKTTVCRINLVVKNSRYICGASSCLGCIDGNKSMYVAYTEEYSCG